MATVVLSAAKPSIPSLDALSAELSQELQKRGVNEVKLFELADCKLAYCQGDFDCWVKTPGQCRALDVEQDIVQAVHEADNLILLDEITFGGLSYTVKRAQDRLLCLLSPFFEKRFSLTHHAPRYDNVPNYYMLGWQKSPDLGQAQTWRDLADANAVNMLCPKVGTAVVDDSIKLFWPREIRSMFDNAAPPGRGIVDRDQLRKALFDVAYADPKSGVARLSKVAVLIGSAKPKGISASESMANVILNRFAQEKVPCELHYATEFVRDTGAAQRAAESIAEADLFVLVTPLYFDALPALVTHTLELVSQQRQLLNASARFATLINCGFPEPEHIRTAISICRHFCAHSQYQFAGALPLGGGGVISPGQTLEPAAGPTIHVVKAIDLACQSLCCGEVISNDAIDLMAEAPMPDVLYRLAGDLGWRYQAYKNGISQASLRAKPLDS